MKVRYRERAFADLQEIHRFLEPHSPIGARNVLRAIRDAVEAIARTPHGSRQTSDPEIRVKVLGRYRYKIFYSVRSDTIEIVHPAFAASALEGLSIATERTATSSCSASPWPRARQ